MIKVNKPSDLNVKQLFDELIAGGIKTLKLSNAVVGLNYEVPVLDGSGNFYLAIDESEIALAKEICKNHKSNNQ